MNFECCDTAFSVCLPDVPAHPDKSSMPTPRFSRCVGHHRNAISSFGVEPPARPGRKKLARRVGGYFLFCYNPLCRPEDENCADQERPMRRGTEMASKTSTSKAMKERLFALKLTAAEHLLMLVGPSILTLARDEDRWGEMRVLLLKVASTKKHATHGKTKKRVVRNRKEA
jgi:hypothetical protein